MTRTYSKKPAWAWVCDECGIEAFIARTQQELPSMEDMRKLGWFIADKFGDLCPKCIAERG